MPSGRKLTWNYALYLIRGFIAFECNPEFQTIMYKSSYHYTGKLGNQFNEVSVALIDSIASTTNATN